MKYHKQTAAINYCDLNFLFFSQWKFVFCVFLSFFSYIRSSKNTFTFYFYYIREITKFKYLSDNKRIFFLFLLNLYWLRELVGHFLLMNCFKWRINVVILYGSVAREKSKIKIITSRFYGWSLKLKIL